MAKQKQIANANVHGYSQCMDEIKERISEIDFRLNVPSDIETRSNVETLALNFRKVFELIIMACQAAHEHKIGRPVREWRIKNLEHLMLNYNASFFMTPVHGTEKEIVDRPCDCLTLDELKNGYKQCGEWLHAWTPYIGAPDFKTALVAFRAWRKKIVLLLNSHKIQLDEGNFLYCCMNAAGTMKTHVSLFTRVPDPAPAAEVDGGA